MGRVFDAAFPPYGQRILTVSRDSYARVYRVLTLGDLAELLSK